MPVATTPSVGKGRRLPCPGCFLSFLLLPSFALLFRFHMLSSSYASVDFFRVLQPVFPTVAADDLAIVCQEVFSIGPTVWQPWPSRWSFGMTTSSCSIYMT